MSVPRCNPFISTSLIFGPTILLCLKTSAAADGKKSETTGPTPHLTAVRDLYTRAATATTTNQVVYSTRPIFLNDQGDQQGPMFLGGIRIVAYIQMKMADRTNWNRSKKQWGDSGRPSAHCGDVQHVLQFATHNNSNGKQIERHLYSQAERKKKSFPPLGCIVLAHIFL
jgi:hypothetical protein